MHSFPLALAFLLALAAPALACPGCRVQQSPSFHFVMPLMLIVLPYWTLLVLKAGVSAVAGERGTRRARTRAYLSMAAHAALGTGLGFALTYLFESACWFALDGRWISMANSGPLYTAARVVAYLGVAVMAAALLAGRRVDGLPAERLGRWSTLVHPAAGFWTFAVAFGCAAATTVEYGIGIKVLVAVHGLVCLATLVHAHRPDPLRER